MYYFHVQFTNGDTCIVRVEHCGNMVWDVDSAKREGRRIVAEHFSREDFVIKVAWLEDVLSQLTFTENITCLS